MLWLIHDNQIAGIADPETLVGLPAAFEAIEGIDAPIAGVYWDKQTQTIELKPEQPSPQHFWNPQTNQWQDAFAIEAPVVEPITLKQATAQAQESCLQYWADKIQACTAGYPAVEVATWIDFKRDCERLIATQDLDQGLSIYHEIMLRQFGAIATPEYCQQFRQGHSEQALAMTLAFAEAILQKTAYLLPELTRLKGLRGYHWEQIEALETIEAVRGYDFRTT